MYTCLLCGQLSPAGISTCAPRLGQASFQNQFTFLFSPKEVLPPGPRPGRYVVALGGLVFCFLLYFSGPAGLQLATWCICSPEVEGTPPCSAPRGLLLGIVTLFFYCLPLPYPPSIHEPHRAPEPRQPSACVPHSS